MTDYKTQLRAAEYTVIDHALQRENGNVSAAAKYLEMPVRTLWRKIDRLGMDPAEWRIDYDRPKDSNS